MIMSTPCMDVVISVIWLVLIKLGTIYSIKQTRLISRIRTNFYINSENWLDKIMCTVQNKTGATVSYKALNFIKWA